MKLDHQTRQQATSLPLLITKPLTPLYPPLSQVTKPNLNTAHAAYLLSRTQQTLRVWACTGKGPIRPLVISGRLAWPVAELQRVLSGG
jgi:hypothetical protein